MADDLSRRLAGLTPEQRELLLRRLKKEGLAAPGESRSPAGPAASAAPLFTLDPGPEPEPSDRPIDFSLFFFSDGGAKSPAESYDLLLESARFADCHGFAAVWTPERHFQDFGGLYPNPSILGAALAAATERLGIRAGSVVLPLHPPLRIAEEWAVVDRLSNGRAGVSFASGWHPTDFALRPEGYPDRRELMFRGIETVRRLWRGEAEVPLEPRPVQPELPVWVTCSTNAATWTRAGEIGAHALTIVQPLPALAEKIARYRAARAERGFDPEAGRVTVMVHAFVGDDEDAVREKVRAPMTAYLKTYFDQYGFLAGGAQSLQGVRAADVDALLSLAFESYFASLSLLGHPDKGARLINRMRGIGVDEAACLIDFGVDAPSILEALPALDRLRARL